MTKPTTRPAATRTNRPTIRYALAYTLAAALTASAGCYKRVTKAQGIGAESRYPDRAEPSTNPIDETLDTILEPEDE